MHDQFGQPVSCASPAAIGAYDRAVDAHLHAWPGVLEAMQEALDHDPGFALVHALRALVLAGRGERTDARAALERAGAAPQEHPRERSHIELIRAVVEGRTRDALPGLIEHARRFPRDALAMSTAMGAYGLFAFSGRADHDAARLEFVESLAPHYPGDFPWLLANRGWARIEAGQVDEGLAMARRALSLRPQNAHNAHVVMHGYFEQHEPAAALDFLGQWLPGYPDTALMWGHLHWHAALAYIELGQIDEALRMLLGPLTGYLPHGLPFMGLADMVALSWRLGLLGATGLPWSLMQQHVQRHYPRGTNVFGELHIAMLAAARGDRDALDAVQQRLRAIAGTGHEGAPVAIRWTRGLRTLLDGDGPAAQADLDACWKDSPRLGGSGAQRGVIEQTREALRIPS